MKNERRIYDPGDPNAEAINKKLPFTRRIPKLSLKQRIRDSQVVEAIIYANDVLHMPEMSLEIFIDRQKTLSDQVYWDLLRTQWITAGKSENIGIFLELFRSKRRHRDWFMTLEDAAFLESLPDEFEAYRAARDKDDLGVSWTLDKEFAEKYAAAYGRVVLTRQVKKSEVFAYISRRGESELLILEAAR